MLKAKYGSIWIQLSFIFVIVILLAAFEFLYLPLNKRALDSSIIILPGASAKKITRNLVQAKQITPWQGKILYYYIKLKGYGPKIKAGKYAFNGAITSNGLLYNFTHGIALKSVVRIQEGMTFSKLLDDLRNHPDIKNTVGDDYQKIISKVNGDYSHPEGLFFPETYYFEYGTPDLQILQRAHLMMLDKLQLAYNERDKAVKLEPYAALNLASIVEKEASSITERANIAGIFLNRLQRKMRLQADPTVIYGLQASFTGKLTKKHLQQKTAYNTYTNKGLPPTPICMPSMGSIMAVMHPVQNDNLYFVAKGDGTHYFSATLEEHNQAVLKYQIRKS